MLNVQQKVQKVLKYKDANKICTKTDAHRCKYAKDAKI